MTEPTDIALLEMSGKEDYVMRPIRHGYCRFESVIDGTLDLIHIAIMNEAIDVAIANNERLTEANRKKH